jgi:hypothetical protein
MRADAVRTGTTAPGVVFAGTPARPAPDLSDITPNAQNPIKQGVARNANSGATPRLPATHLRLRLLDPEIDPLRAIKGRQEHDGNRNLRAIRARWRVDRLDQPPRSGA